MSEKDFETEDAVLEDEHVEDQEDDEEVESEDSSEEKDEREESGSDEDEDSEDEEEREAIRARRREERKHRKQAQKEREDTLRRELAARDAIINDLRSRMDAVDRRNTGSEIAQIENAKKQTAQAYQYFKDQIRIATESGNGAAVADATEKMIQAQRKFDEISTYEKAMRSKQASPQPLDPRLASHAQSWMSRNSWYDPSAKNPDSRVTMALDQQLSEEGWDPTTKEYWEELDNRVKKYLPHRAKVTKISSTTPKSVVAGAGRESSKAPAKAAYKLSAERVQALKDAGVWDDPKQRADAIRRFREYDKQNQV